MSHKRKIRLLIFTGILSMILLFSLTVLRKGLNPVEQKNKNGTYQSLKTDIVDEDPLKHIAEDYTVEEGFHTNLPIVILSLEGEISQYKSFSNQQEVVDETVEPYTDGCISIIDSPQGENYLTDTPVYSSDMRVKKRGHTSFSYDKPQYLMKMIHENGEKNETEILGMGIWLIRVCSETICLTELLQKLAEVPCPLTVNIVKCLSDRTEDMNIRASIC